MVFSSYLFVFYFLPLSLLLYYAVPSRRGRHFFLTTLSTVFYGWANPRFIPLMFVTISIDYLAGRVQAHDGFRGWKNEIVVLPEGGPRSRTQKLALLVAIVSNIGLLAWFKYANFALDNWRALAAYTGLPLWDTALRVTLPLGISFYTFQAMSYAIDVYRGHTLAMRSFLDYATFVSMYQQLVAGPIVRFADVADQLRGHSHTLSKVARGVALFACGLAMKVLLANPCGKVADTVFNAGPATALDAWLGVFAYSLQIFFDFAAYSEMAIGLGLLCGWVFAKNFETPYQSRSITEFWRRWHISLSTWLRDYLYIPLGGNRHGETRTYFNLWITMLLGGLWHGASWNFLLWGAWHGAWLALERRRGPLWKDTPPLVQTVCTFGVVLLSWTLFRTADFPAAISYFQALFGFAENAPGALAVGGLILQPYYLVSIALAAYFAFCCRSAWDWTQKLSLTKAFACLLLLWFALVMLLTQAYNPFIYFIF
ncbi:MAG TPA: MBOAT family O-acyltransferase [Abditibacteriaceae bacterium]|jgi:alginate O-acetyltransferase complex protein AlgI